MSVGMKKAIRLSLLQMNKIKIEQSSALFFTKNFRKRQKVLTSILNMLK